MSDDDRDIDVESDVRVIYIQPIGDQYMYYFLQEGEDSDSRQPPPRQTSGNQYFSQVKVCNIDDATFGSSFYV